MAPTKISEVAIVSAGLLHENRCQTGLQDRRRAKVGLLIENELMDGITAQGIEKEYAYKPRAQKPKKSDAFLGLFDSIFDDDAPAPLRQPSPEDMGPEFLDVVGSGKEEEVYGSYTSPTHRASTIVTSSTAFRSSTSGRQSSVLSLSSLTEKHKGFDLDFEDLVVRTHACGDEYRQLLKVHYSDMHSLFFCHWCCNCVGLHGMANDTVGFKPKNIWAKMPSNFNVDKKWYKVCANLCQVCIVRSALSSQMERKQGIRMNKASTYESANSYWIEQQEIHGLDLVCEANANWRVPQIWREPLEKKL
ncbi:hypothetical protein B0O99DRAFT_679912 [Bisporella sp. PMI_857]|nr:hypothetical protein B0O99DRAFT_679912 [Bisporella sp. PMI_857]